MARRPPISQLTPTPVLGSGNAARSDLPDIQSLFPEGLPGNAGGPPEQRLRGCPRGCRGVWAETGSGRCWALTASSASRGKEVSPWEGDRAPGGSTQIPGDGGSWYPSSRSGSPSPRVQGNVPRRRLLAAACCSRRLSALRAATGVETRPGVYSPRPPT